MVEAKIEDQNRVHTNQNKYGYLEGEAYIFNSLIMVEKMMKEYPVVTDDQQTCFIEQFQSTLPPYVVNLDV